MKEDGCHVWRLRHFSKPNHCNACCSLLVGWGGKQGLSCSLCKYTVHERCVRTAARNCIKTFSVRTMGGDRLYHHWQDANTTAKCVKCRNTVGAFQGKRCRWCHNYVHHRCMSALPQDCDMGVLAYHMLPPTHIFPAFLERKSSSLMNFHPHGSNLLQLVGLESAMQMGQIKAGVRGARGLSQCSNVVIQTHKSFPMQIEGEPWMQPPCIIQMTHKNQAKMLVAPSKRSSWCLLKRQSTADDI